MADPLPKYARVSTTNPENWAQCDRCSFWRNSSDLVWQTAWAGQHLYRIQILVCRDRCFDIPNEQLRTIILPPDPPPILNARVPNFAYAEDGPPQTQLSADVVQGAVILPVDDASVFSTGDLILIQLNNANFAEEQVTGIDAVLNTISILSPLPFSAPIYGQISLAPVQ